MDQSMSELRSRFPAINQQVHGHPLVYLDSAASSLKPQEVINVINQHYEKETANVHRGIHFLSAQGTKKYEESRTCLQQFINAKSESEVIFTKGTTDSLNLVAYSFVPFFLKKGDKILLTTMEHHSNIVPWQMIAQKEGLEILECPILDNGELDIDAYSELIKDNVKLVSLCHVSNTLGTINPIKKLAKLAHDNNAYICIDAAQSAPHIQIDVQDIDCDFLALSAHKLFGPTGVGILYGKQELLEKMPPYQGGGAMIKEVSFQGTTYNDLPEKFEAGTPNISGVIAFKSAIKFILDIGFEKIHEFEDELLKYATMKLKSINGLSIIGEAKNKSAVVSFVIDGVHPHDLAMILDELGIAIRTGHHCTQPLMKRFNVVATARASFCIYNNKQDIDKLIIALEKAIEILR